MAIPPIISNNPLLKLFKTDKPDVKQGGGVAATPEDIVEISEAAQKRLDGIRSLSAEKQEEIQALASDTRQILEGTGLFLGANSEVS